MDFGPMLLLAVLEGLVGAAVLALAAAGLSLVFGVLRVVNVAHGEFYMLGAMLAWFVISIFPGPAWAGFLLALALAPLAVGAIAALADALILRRLKHGAEATIMATIGLHYMVQQAALSAFGPVAKRVEAPFDFYMELPWFGYSAYKLAVVPMALVVLGGLWLLLARSRLGLVMRATEADPEVARAYGLDTDRIYSAVFALGAGMAALAAVLIVPTRQAEYLMGGDALLLSFIVVIIGGLGSLRGTLLAALLIGLSEGIIAMFWSPTLAKILATLAVAMVLVLRPQGLMGKAER